MNSPPFIPRDPELARTGPSDLVDGGELGLAEAARQLKMSVGIVRRWATSGRIPSTVAGDGTWRFRRHEVEKSSVPGPKPHNAPSTE